METDQWFRERLAQRDADAMSRLVERYVTPVYALVHRILGPGRDADVEECVSDTFHTAWQRIQEYDPERAPLRTWLLILAKYQALDRNRQLRAIAGRVAQLDHGLPDQASGPEEILASVEGRQEVQVALAQLGPVDRELIYRRYFLGEPVQLAAEALGLTRQAADNRLWRARKLLRQLLAPDDERKVQACEG